MFLKFELDNYRSIRSEATLTLSAINYYKENVEQLIDAQLPGLSGMRFLRAAAIFGPNASGKSTVFKALETMKSIVLRSATVSPGSRLPYEPYALDADSRERPTRFLAAFVGSGIRYEYEFSYTGDFVAQERLSAFPKGREQVWFTRETKEVGNSERSTIVKDSSYLRIPAALQPLLNDNALLLSLLANYPKYEAAVKVRPVIDWFAQGLSIVKRGPRAMDDYPFSGEIVDGAAGTNFQRTFIQDMMRRADVGIDKAKVKRIQLDEFLEVAGASVNRSELAALIEGRDLSEEFKSVVFEHEGTQGKVEFGFDQESEGTFQLFSLSGHVAQALENGSVLFVDEIDASLHPILVQEVVRCFLDPISNPNNAQLVFTAHNPCLLEDGLLRRDQIWLTEKVAGATDLFPLSDYSPRKDESLSSGYLIGRYSATPLVPSCFGRCGFAAEGGVDGK